MARSHHAIVGSVFSMHQSVPQLLVKASVVSCLRDLECAANLRLNASKCQCIPLCDASPEDMRERLRLGSPGWERMSVQGHGKYLGFVVGPEAGDQSWDAPMAKVGDKMKAWSWAEMGLFYAASVWNIFIIPSLLYVAQLCKVPVAVESQVERWMLQAWPGPYNRVSCQDLACLHRAYGFPIEFKTLRLTSHAAQFRWESELVLFMLPPRHR